MTELFQPPIDFLLICSSSLLQEFELVRLNEMVNLRKKIAVMENHLREVTGEALLARWLIEHREELMELGRTQALQKPLNFPDGALIEPRAAFGALNRGQGGGAD